MSKKLMEINDQLNKIKEGFHKFREDKDYINLGWFFWNGFVLYGDAERKLLSELWDSLPTKEQRLCEKV